MSTGACPFNCTYCYIPKTPLMHAMHEAIIESLESGKFIDIFKEVYGHDLEYFGLWGTEPTLTLPIIQRQMDTIMKEFPKLQEISFSTSMMTDPQILADWIISNKGRDLTLSIQISLDGPAWITDVNRIPGAAEQIPKNFRSLLEKIQDLDLSPLKVKFKWKATHGIDNFKMVIDNPDLMDDYKAYFIGLNKMFDQVNRNKSVRLDKETYRPTLVVPGKYTSSDGKLFAEYVKTIHNHGERTVYTFRIDRVFKYWYDLYKRRMFSCSGGDSNLGLDSKEVHICHRTFYLNNPEYVQAILDQDDIENWDVSLFKKGTLDFIQKYYIVDPFDKKEWVRFQYTMRGYHDSWKFQLSYISAMLIELARAGQVDPIYETDANLRMLFGLFSGAGLSCPMENLLNTGSIHLQVVSLLRLFCNGAFQEILKTTDTQGEFHDEL